MNTEEMLVRCKADQLSLEAKRAAIILRLGALQAEIDAAVAVSEYARRTMVTDGDAAHNLSNEKLDPSDVIPLVKDVSMTALIEWERIAALDEGLERKYRKLLVRPE